MKVKLYDGTEIEARELREHVRKSLAGTTGEQARMEDVRFLEILLLQGPLTLDNVPELVSNSRRRQLSLPDEAMASNIINESTLTDVLARQYGLRTVDLTQEKLDYGFAQTLDAYQARRFGALPLRYEESEGKTVIALTRPDNLRTIDELPLFLRLDPDRIEWALVRQGDFEEILRRAYETDEQEAEAEVQDLRADAGLSAPALKLISRIISQAQTKGASDIHFERWERKMVVRYRMDGVLHIMEEIPSNLSNEVIGALKNMAKLRYDERRRPQDGRILRDFGYGRLNLRLVTTPTPDGEEIVLRLLDNRMMHRDFDDLGIEDHNLELWDAQLRRSGSGGGLVIVTGDTGSGKSTTLYAALERLRGESLKIITIEDPVEQRVAGITQIQVDEAQGITFAKTLTSILRADPDVIMVGEIRDKSTAQVAVEAALTGHLVLATLHTKNAIGAVVRLQEMDIEKFLISASLSLVTAQKLVRRLCIHCRQETKLTQEIAEQLKAPAWVVEKTKEEGPIDIFEHNENGCPQCLNTGYRGRAGIHEVLQITDEIREAIAAEQSSRVIAELAESQGMKTLRSDVFNKIIRGQTDIKEYERIVAV